MQILLLILISFALGYFQGYHRTKKRIEKSIPYEKLGVAMEMEPIKDNETDKHI